MQPPKPEFRQSRVINASPVYYGWVILLIGSFGIMMTMPGQTVSTSVFLDHMIEDLDLSRTTVSLMYTLATFVASFALPFVGRFIDMRGPRLAVAIISALFAMACIYMGFVHGLVMLFFGFVLIRGLGQGALSMVSQHIINIWFVRRRGVAMGISGLGAALGTAFTPALIETLIGRFDWRITFMILGGIIAVTILPLGAWLYRRQPEYYGLEPDGKAQLNRKAISETNLTLQQARRTAIFWLFVSSILCTSSLGTAMLFHNYDILSLQGLGRDIATRVFVPIGFVLFAANLTTGYLLDRFSPRIVLVIAQSLLAAALFLATRVTSLLEVYVYGSILGLMMGMNGTLSATVFAHYFGRKHLGTIRGLVSTFGVAASAFGPFLFAFGKDLFGGYRGVLLLSSLFPLVLLGFIPFVKPPKST